MNKLLERRWISVVLWVAVLVTSILIMPNTQKLISEKGDSTFGSTYSTTIANHILKEMDKSSNVASAKTKQVSMVLIYYNKNTLSSQDKQNIKEKVDNLKSQKDKYGILTVSDLFSNSDLADSYISKDKTSLLVPVTIDRGTRMVDAIRSSITGIMKADGSELYATSGDLINSDFALETHAGVQKTELITVIFIIIVLLLIFRSPVTPLINLMAVGFSFLISLNLTFQLVQYLNFPVSNFTEIFLILILFGIGTDYTLLLLMRYREELSKGFDVNTAILNTYKTAGKTILFSSFTILIGFVCLFFVQFYIYRSASAVALGIAVLDLILFTFVPAIMKLFGKNLFWSPFKIKEHHDSKAWGAVAGFAAKCPYIAIAFSALVCCLIFFTNKQLTYNNLAEVEPSYPSIQGYNIVAKEFSTGEAMPLTIAVKNPDAMNSQSDLSELDAVTRAMKGINGVKSVYSVTQPKGAKINSLYINSQAKVLNNGLGSAGHGITQIRDGLNGAIDQLNAATRNTGSLGQLQSGIGALTNGLDSAASSSQQLSAGLAKLQPGSESLAANLMSLEKACNQLENGTSAAASVSPRITHGIEQVKSSLSGMQAMLNGMVNSYGAMKTALTGAGTSLQDVGTNLTSAGGSLTDLHTQITSILAHGGASAYGSELMAMGADLSAIQTKLGAVNSDLLGMQTVLQGMSSSSQSAGLAKAQHGLTALLDGLDKLDSASSKLSSGMITVSDGQKKVADAVTQLGSGAQQLADGLSKVADGQTKITGGLSKLTSGAKQIQSGLKLLISSVEKVSTQASKLSNGLKDAAGGLNRISNGLGSATSYLSGLLGSSYAGSVFYIPDDKINSGDFVKSMNTYMSSDRRIAKFIVTLSVDPYSSQAMEITQKISDAVRSCLKYSSLKNAAYGISGVSQNNIDLCTMSNSDYSKATLIMLTGIFIILLFISRSFWLPVFVMGSLIASYYISIALSGLFFRGLVNQPQLSWLVPFCSFVMIIALGVDYSIFMITRHNENKNMPEADSIVKACRKVGGVITSAALILSGTFASMYPSGVVALMEISVTVIIGLIMLCFIFLPVTIPALVSLKAKADMLRFNDKPSKMTEEE